MRRSQCGGALGCFGSELAPRERRSRSLALGPDTLGDDEELGHRGRARIVHAVDQFIGDKKRCTFYRSSQART